MHWHSKYHHLSATAFKGYRTCRDCSISAFSSASLFARSACISLLSSTCFDIVRLEIWSPCGALKMPSGSCNKQGICRKAVRQVSFSQVKLQNQLSNEQRSAGQELQTLNSAASCAHPTNGHHLKPFATTVTLHHCSFAAYTGTGEVACLLLQRLLIATPHISCKLRYNGKRFRRR